MAATKPPPTLTTLLCWLAMAQRMAKTTGSSATPGPPLGEKQAISSFSVLTTKKITAAVTSLLGMAVAATVKPSPGKCVALAAS